METLKSSEEAQRKILLSPLVSQAAMRAIQKINKGKIQVGVGKRRKSGEHTCRVSIKMQVCKASDRCKIPNI